MIEDRSDEDGSKRIHLSEPSLGYGTTFLVDVVKRSDEVRISLAGLSSIPVDFLDAEDATAIAVLIQEAVAIAQDFDKYWEAE